MRYIVLKIYSVNTHCYITELLTYPKDKKRLASSKSFFYNFKKFIIYQPLIQN